MGTTTRNFFYIVPGCTEQCPFCNAQCELTSKNHSTTGNIKHQTQHRPRCLGERNWEEDGKMVLDVCTYSVSDSTTWTDRLEIACLQEIFREWTIPADKSLESSLIIGSGSLKITPVKFRNLFVMKKLRSLVNGKNWSGQKLKIGL